MKIPVWMPRASLRRSSSVTQSTTDSNASMFARSSRMSLGSWTGNLKKSSSPRSRLPRISTASTASSLSTTSSDSRWSRFEAEVDELLTSTPGTSPCASPRRYDSRGSVTSSDSRISQYTPMAHPCASGESEFTEICPGPRRSSTSSTLSGSWSLAGSLSTQHLYRKSIDPFPDLHEDRDGWFCYFDHTSNGGSGVGTMTKQTVRKALHRTHPAWDETALQLAFDEMWSDFASTDGTTCSAHDLLRPQSGFVDMVVMRMQWIS